MATNPPTQKSTVPDQHIQQGNADASSVSGAQIKSGRAPIDDSKPLSKSPQDSPSFVIVMGTTGSGKTTFVNQASESDLEVGHDLKPCTSDAQVSKEFTVNGRQVFLVDTPGLNDTNTSDSESLRAIAGSSGKLLPPGAKFAGVIYIHRISDDRFGGSAVKCLQMFRKLCKERALKNVVFVTNMWGQVTQEEGKAREKQLRKKYLKPAMRKDTPLRRHVNTPESAREILGILLGNDEAMKKRVGNVRRRLHLPGRSRRAKP